MAYNAAPSGFFGAGYSLAANVAGFTTADGSGCLAQLTDVEANATTGDWRKIVFAIMEQLNVNWQAMAVEDRPAKVNIYKSSILDANTGIVTNTYTVTCTNEVSAQDVVDEDPA